MKKLNFEQLKAKANSITNAEALNAIKGGDQTSCHNVMNPPPVVGPIGGSKPTYGGGL